jgi:hypothetical protein
MRTCFHTTAVNEIWSSFRSRYVALYSLKHPGIESLPDLTFVLASHFPVPKVTAGVLRGERSRFQLFGDTGKWKCCYDSPLIRQLQLTSESPFFYSSSKHCSPNGIEWGERENSYLGANCAAVEKGRQGGLVHCASRQDHCKG